jgi:hypothetical protein
VRELGVWWLAVVGRLVLLWLWLVWGAVAKDAGLPAGWQMVAARSNFPASTPKSRRSFHCRAGNANWCR